MKNVSNSFQTFLTEAPEHAKAWMNMVKGLDSASVLDKKTEELAYLAVMAAVGLEGGIPFHVKQVKAYGATREELKSAILIGLPAVGNQVVSALAIALHAYDEE